MRNMDACLYVGPSDRMTLERLIADGKTPQKIVKRATIVLLSRRGLGTNAIIREARVSKPCACGRHKRPVQRWTSTGILQCVSTLTVSLPRTIAEMPRRP